MKLNLITYVHTNYLIWVRNGNYLNYNEFHIKSVNQLPWIRLVIVNSFDRSKDEKTSYMTTKQMTLYSILKWKWLNRFKNQASPFLIVRPSCNHIIYFIPKNSIQCWNLVLTVSFQGLFSMIQNCHK